MTPDVNVLVAASRKDHPHHSSANAWLRETLALAASGGAVRVGLLPMVVSGFLRVVTNQRVFRDPTPVGSASEFMRAILDHEGVVVLDLGPESRALIDLCEKRGLAAGDVTDAWIAAAVRAHAEHLVTFDRGFRKLLNPARLTVLEP